MLELEELRLFLVGLEEEIANLADALGIERLKRQLEEERMTVELLKKVKEFERM